jgi:hypothetical protein
VNGFSRLRVHHAAEVTSGRTRVEIGVDPNGDRDMPAHIMPARDRTDPPSEPAADRRHRRPFRDRGAGSFAELTAGDRPIDHRSNGGPAVDDHLPRPPLSAAASEQTGPRADRSDAADRAVAAPFDFK